MSPRAGVRGAALVAALLAVALVAALAGAMVEDQGLQAFFYEARHDGAQARQYARAGVDWARVVLEDDARSGSMDHPGEAWATRIPPTRVDDTELSGYLEEQQGRFNVNALVQGGQGVVLQHDVLVRLLGNLGLAPGLADVLTAVLLAAPPGTALAPPLRETSVLAAIPGFDPATLGRLEPLLTALPDSVPVNANFADPRLLAALIPGLAAQEAQALVAGRDAAPFRDLADLRSRLPRPGMSVLPALVGAASRYFRAEVMVQAPHATVRLAALLDRDTVGSTVVWSYQR